MQRTKNELVQLWANGDKRKEFVKDYKAWGVWLTVPELGLTYYRYDLSENERILAMEYQHRNMYPASESGKLQTTASYYLWEGDLFSPNFASEWLIVDRLKNLKVEMQKELRAGQGT